jgi:hypothetical protein
MFSVSREGCRINVTLAIILHNYYIPVDKSVEEMWISTIGRNEKLNDINAVSGCEQVVYR